MDFEQAELQFQELRELRACGELDEATYRLKVAELLFRDEQGIFWMPDPDEGTWFHNQGEGWEPGDPKAARALETYEPEKKSRRRLGWTLGLAFAVVVIAGLAVVLILRQWSGAPWNSDQQAAIIDASVQVTIASPADGSQVALDHAVAIESTIDAPDLQLVDHAILFANGQTVGRLLVQPKLNPGQTSLPLSQPWLPSAAGEYLVTVRAFSTEDEPLGEDSITLHAEETADQTLPDPDCVPDATFVKDVTIPSDTAFPPGSRMEKVWQVRNSGTCAWGVGYEIALVSGESMGTPGAVPVPPTAAGEVADLSVTMWAPEEPGAYDSDWQLQAPDGTFFGPKLTLQIQVQPLAEESLPPAAPTELQATTTEDNKAVRLTWHDQSDNEDAFRIYREDVEASIGLAPADTESFVDENIACGNTYRYAVIAFNATGFSPATETAQVTLPPCAPADEPPVLDLSATPTQALATEPFTITYLATDDAGVAQVTLQGEDTGAPTLDAGRTITCTEPSCTGQWVITWTDEISATPQISLTLTLVGMAIDSSGQESEPTWVKVTIAPPE